MAATTLTVRRRRIGPHRRCERGTSAYARLPDGRLVRFILINEYDEFGTETRVLIKRLGHRRYARGRHCYGMDHLAGWLSDLPDETWVQVNFATGAAHVA
jgi:hypothetical protein